MVKSVVVVSSGSANAQNLEQISQPYQVSGKKVQRQNQTSHISVASERLRRSKLGLEASPIIILSKLFPSTSIGRR